MPSRVSPDEWKPTEGIVLDPVSDRVVRSNHNMLVIAGPGAGKTELLSQRACYLLLTHLCPPPRRILAISFKRDSAANLRDRVEQRCGTDLARRLDSMTYHAFAKHLIDRFRNAIPRDHRPTLDYEVVLNEEQEAKESLKDILNTIPEDEHKEFLSRILRLHEALPYPFLDSPVNFEQHVVDLLWKRFISQTPSKLTFPMITRLASLVLRSTPTVLKALQATYSHVFLDEYQDTTESQYDLLCAAFKGTDTIITAVGDNKQQIMGYAGAMENAFDRFQADFSAERVHLLINHRSAPRLVQIQQAMARWIDPSAVQVQSDQPALNGECQIWEFSNPDQEAEVVADHIAGWIYNEGVDPRQICILVRRSVDLYAERIIKALRQRKVQARDESTYQRLMAEPAVRCIIGYLELLVRESAPDAWTQITSLLMDLRGYTPDTPTAKVRTLETAFSKFLQIHRKIISELHPDAPDGKKRFMDVIDAFFERMLGKDQYRYLYPQYIQGQEFNRVCRDTARRLWSDFRNLHNWSTVLDQFKGIGIVPIMTVHKSKGLEFDTVVFVGLEDDAFWKYTEQQTAEDCTFFVALSRAKRRMYFTFSEQRQTGYQRTMKRQSFEKILVLREVLENAGVPVIRYRNT